MPSVPANPDARRRARVTVITRTKDRPLLLRRCVESVLAQSFADWLHVIVNDGGNPHVANLVVAEQAARYAGRVEVIHHPESVGMQNASNRGLAAAAGDFVVIHDDDDSWERDFLRACVEFLDAEGPDSPVQGVATQTTRILEEFNDDGSIHECGREHYLPVRAVGLFKAASENPFAPIAFVYRRAVHERLGLFEERFSVVGDWDFNLRFLSHHEIGVINRRLANYHWRHRSGGTIYANTVTDALDEHHRKTVALRNHYLREDLRTGKTGLGYLMNTALSARDHADAVEGVRRLTEHSIHETRKVQSRLLLWQWFLTRNRRLKETLGFGSRKVAPTLRHVAAHARPALPAVPAASCRGTLAGLFSGGAPAPKVLSLDVFDTALLRVVRQPVDAFHLIAPGIRRELGADDELPVALLRGAAERAARARRHREAGHDEVDLWDIYAEFCAQAGVDPAVYRDRLAAVEAEVEAAVLYANPVVLAAADAAERAGTRVVFVSDMYLPREFIVEALRRAGYGVDKGALYLSSERGVSKHGGGLFDVLLQELGVAPADVLHVGDNFHSDVERARQHGLRTLHWNPDDGQPLADQPATGQPAPFAEDDLLSSLCTGLVRRSRATVAPPAEPGDGAWWERLGYEVGGPIYFTFLHWLLVNARRERRDRLFFLARDGHYLRQACEILSVRAGYGVEAIEMAASRRLLNVPGITALDHTAMPFLLTPNPGLQVRHFFTRLGLVPEAFADEARQAGFASLDEAVTTGGGVFRSERDHVAMHRLFSSLGPRLLDHAAGERARLERYFDGIGFDGAHADRMAVVDLGWQASSARALQTLLNLRASAERRPPRALRAFYFGTWHFAQLAVDAGCRLSSFFFHLDQPGHRRGLVSESVEIVEAFFGAPHGTITGLREGADGRMEPVHGEPEHGPVHGALIARMRERAVDFVRDAAALARPGELLDWTGTGVGYLEAVLDRLLRRPTAEEARVLGTLPARDSFGGDSPTRPLAQPPSHWERLLHPARLRHAYQHAFWKQGFLAQLSPREAVRAQGAG